MGCLRNIINIIILALAIIGFLSIGGKEFLDNQVMPMIKNFNVEIQSQIDKKDKKLNELTIKELTTILTESLKSVFITKHTNAESEITEIKGLMGYDTKITEDIKSGQKIVVVDTKDKILLDLNKTDKAELKADMLNLAKKHKALPIKFDDFDIIEVGNWKVYDENLRYVKVNVKDSSTGSDIEAIISTIPNETDSQMIITFAQKSKFNKKIAQKYLKK